MPRLAMIRESPAKATGIKIAIIREANSSLPGDMGRSISRAVDVVEVVRNRFVQDMKRDITIGTETINSKDRGTLNVSTIDILLKK